MVELMLPASGSTASLREGHRSLKLTFAVKLLLVLIAGLVSLVVAIGAALLSRSSDAALPAAVLCGAGAFAVSMTLCLCVMSALGLTG
ncbi:hypothetical protein [Streptomyces sp. NPDC017991]|uniref:hypothetical protein n=1 Tax=Streptomyces sp. NPDC017991 TaxID=3365026 RepID=UPI0037911211